MNKRIISNLVSIVVLLIIAVTLYFTIGRPEQKKEVHSHAGFQVYVDGALQNFAELKYMNLKPCGGIFNRENDQLEKAHLHDNVGDVVHVHREGAVWGDLFKNIQWEIPADKEFIGYLNGERKEDILTYPILPYDSVVFFSGKVEDLNRKLQGRVTEDTIKEVEKKSENCGEDEDKE